MKIFHYGLLCLVAIVLAGCGRGAALEDPVKTLRYQSAKQIYQQLEAAFARQDYTTALKFYDALDAIHAFSPYAEVAHLRRVQSYYHREDMPAVLLAAESFIQYYPKSTRLEEVFYLKALAHLHKGQIGILHYLKLDMAKRDPSDKKLAQKEFLDFIERFPKSIRIPKVKQKLADLHRLFADYELAIIDYYFRKKAYVAVINRAVDLIQAYADTPAAQKAKLLQQEAERVLGLRAYSS